MGFTVYAPRQDGNARFNSLQVQLTESSSITRVVVADGNGKLFYGTGAGGGTGTVTNVSVITANGLAGTVANPTTTPAITLSTSVTGILKGDGTAISAATPGVDYITSTQGTASWAQNVVSSSYAATASYVLNASAVSASYAATASYLDPNFLLPKVFQIVTGSVSASVNVVDSNLFLINQGNTKYINISSSGDTDIYSNLFIIRNFTTKQPVLTVSQSIVQIATQSLDPTGNTIAGGFWFTSSSFYVGLE